MLAALQRYALPVLLLTLVNACFSGYQVLSKLAFQEGTSPIVYALLRDGIATALFLPTLYARERALPAEERQLLPRREHLSHFFALGLCLWASSIMSALAISYLSPVLYALLTPTAPVVTLLLSYLLGQEVFAPLRPGSWLKCAGILASVGGATVLVLLGRSGAHGGGASPAGGAGLGGLAFIAAHKLAAGAYPMIQKHCLTKFAYPSLTLAAWGVAIGFGLIVMSASTSALSAAAWRVSPAAWGGIAFSGVFSSYFNYLAMAHVNSQASPLLVMSFYPLQSLFTPLLAAAALGSTELGLGELVGGATVALGLLLCVAGQALDGGAAPGAPGSSDGTGKAALDDCTEAATLVLTLGDVRQLEAAVRQEEEGEEGAASAAPGRARRGAPSAVLPILERALSRSNAHWRAGGGGAPAAGQRQQPPQQQQQQAAREDTPFLRTPAPPPAGPTQPARAILARAKSLTALARSAERVAVGLG